MDRWREIPLCCLVGLVVGSGRPGSISSSRTGTRIMTPLGIGRREIATADRLSAVLRVLLATPAGNPFHEATQQPESGGRNRPMGNRSRSDEEVPGGRDEETAGYGNQIGAIWFLRDRDRDKFFGTFSQNALFSRPFVLRRPSRPQWRQPTMAASQRDKHSTRVGIELGEAHGGGVPFTSVRRFDRGTGSSSTRSKRRSSGRCSSPLPRTQPPLRDEK